MKKPKSEFERKKGSGYSLSMIEDVFREKKTDVIVRRELAKELEAEGLNDYEVEDLIDRAGRQGLIRVLLPPREGGQIRYTLLPSERRDDERRMAEHYVAIIDELYSEEGKDHLSNTKIEEKLASKGLTRDEIDLAIYIGERDYALLHSISYEGVVGYTWVRPEDREEEARYKKRERRYMDEWREKKMMQGEL